VAPARDRPRQLRSREDGEQSITFVELFFDLVCVFAITQISHVLIAHPSLAGDRARGLPAPDRAVGVVSTALLGSSCSRARGDRRRRVRVRPRRDGAGRWPFVAR
jgi:low temperature requirement A protein (LtrA)